MKPIIIVGSLRHEKPAYLRQNRGLVCPIVPEEYITEEGCSSLLDEVTLGEWSEDSWQPN